MKLHPQQIKSVLALPGPELYDHFIKQVVDREEVWGLYKDGWALAGIDDGTRVFPVWPAEEYAVLCTQNEWQDYKPSSVALNDFMEELLPMLKRGGVLPGIFYTSTNKGITPDVAQLLDDLHQELEKYE